MIKKIVNLLTKKLTIEANNVSQAFYKFDPDTGFWGAPNIKRYVQTDLKSDPMYVSHNSDGNRGVEVNEIDPKGTIVTIGGSHSWGAGVEQNQRYSELLSDETGRQVINIGHASLGFDQVCIAIMKKTKKYNPRIIIIEQYPWAVVRILNGYVNGYVKPVFSIDKDDNLKLKKVPKFAQFPLGRKCIGSYYAYKKELQEFRSGINLQENYNPLTDPVFLYWKINHYDYLYKLLLKITIVIRDYCRQNNIHFLIALGAIHQQFTGSSRSDLIDYDLPRKRLKEILNNLGINHVDMTDAMLNEHTEIDPVIFHDGHLNAKGHNVFSSVLQKELAVRGWI